MTFDEFKILTKETPLRWYHKEMDRTKHLSEWSPYIGSDSDYRLLASYLYETYGLEALILEQELDLHHGNLTPFLPLTTDEKKWILNYGIDGRQFLGNDTYTSFIHDLYPGGSLPLDMYLKYPLRTQIFLMSHYPVSREIVDYELYRFNRDKFRLFHHDNASEWSWALRNLLENKLDSQTQARLDRVCFELG